MNATVAGRALPALLEWLNAHSVEHEIHEHREAFTAASTAKAEGVDARTFAKVVGIVTGDGRNALLVIDAPDRVDLGKAHDVLGGATVRLLDEAELAALTPGCDAGAAPAVGDLFGLPMYVDYAVERDAEISFNAGTHRISVRVDRSEWARAAHVRYADLVIDAGIDPAWAS